MWKTVTSSCINSWLQLSCKSPTCGCNFESSSSANSWCLAKIVPLMSSEPRALDKASNAFVRSPCADSQNFSDPFSKSEGLVLRLWCQCWEELLEHRNWRMLNQCCWLLHVVTIKNRSGSLEKMSLQQRLALVKEDKPRSVLFLGSRITWRIDRPNVERLCIAKKKQRASK